jgi:hypothetical protein
MRTHFPARALLLIALLVLSGREAAAQVVQISPLAGYRFGGSFGYVPTGKVYSLDNAFSYGGTVDFSVSPHWRVEVLYSRQDTALRPSGVPVQYKLAVEEFMLGLQEERGEPNDKAHFFGTVLFGGTRLHPDFGGADATHAAAGFAFGVKFFPTKNFGLRFEGRGLVTFMTASGGTMCVSGTCVFSYTGSTFWQGDLAGGLIFAF